MSSEVAPHIWLSEPSLTFHPDRTSDRAIHPLRGLLRFGPYSAGILPDPIRVATLAPAKESNLLYTFMRRLNSTYTPKERKDYLPEWPGFQRVFGVHMRAADGDCHIELDQELEIELNNSPSPHIVLAERLVRAIQRLQTYRSKFDVLFIYIPQRWNPGYTGVSDEDFDLHDHLKATTANRGIPIQLVREDSALTYSCQASVMWRIGLARVCKGWRSPLEVGGVRLGNCVYWPFICGSSNGI